MNPGITDYFAAEEAIVARLKEVPGVSAVLTPFSVTDMLEASQPTPSIHVIYNGDIVGNSTSTGASVAISQRWLIVLAVRTAKAQLQDTTEARNIAGPLIPLILKALQGWAPFAGMRGLTRVGGVAAGYSSSFAYFPFLFEGRLIT